MILNYIRTEIKKNVSEKTLLEKVLETFQIFLNFISNVIRKTNYGLESLDQVICKRFRRNESLDSNSKIDISYEEKKAYLAKPIDKNIRKTICISKISKDDSFLNQNTQKTSCKIKVRISDDTEIKNNQLLKCNNYGFLSSLEKQAIESSQVSRHFKNIISENNAIKRPLTSIT